MDQREAVAVPMEWDCPAPARSPSVLKFRIEKKQTKKYLQVINVKKSASISSRSSDELGQDDIGLPV